MFVKHFGLILSYGKHDYDSSDLHRDCIATEVLLCVNYINYIKRVKLQQ